MFLRSNLAEWGIGNADSAHATDYVLWRDDGSKISAVFGLTKSGYLLVQMPDQISDLRSLKPFWSGRKVIGMSGASDQVTHVLSALGFRPSDQDMAEDEPLLALDLNKLEPAHDTLRSPRMGDRNLLLKWFSGYGADTGLPFADADIEHRVERALRDGHVQILEEDGRPVAMTSTNAVVDDTVQIGGVFVPESLRNRGYGRRVVAAQLAQARDNGARRAILFAASKAAEAAYVAIGFHRIGTYRVVILKTPKTIGKAH
ncbi:GNAT family N-acetyltransferase [Tateyamaria omphalii]|uniref:GNAT family N-acetyltransferase n=1 Tax=Tateyamaria omphalii TaxID=299262 RepID=UPI0016792DD3|nr:GNAT family N-acetyltransferase [Tateyamaria omphalii]